MNQNNNPTLNGQAIFSGREQTTSARVNEKKSLTLGPLPSTKWVIVLAIASVIAVGISGYLAYVSLTSSKIAGCGNGQLFNCNHVTTSRWSLWLGIPVSLLAVGLYIGMLGSLFVGASKRFSDSIRRLGWTSVSVLAIAAGLSAVWFIYLQVFVLNHLCQYCLAAHACGLLAASVMLWLRPIGVVGLKAISSFSAVGFASLVGGQLLTEAPKAYEIVPYQAPVASEDEGAEFDAPMASSEEAVEFEAPVVTSEEAVEFEAPEIPATRSTKTPKVSTRLPSAFQLKQAIAMALSPAAALNFQVSQPASYSPQSQAKQQSAQTPASTPAANDEPSERRMASINGGTVKLDVAKWPLAGSPTAKHIFVEMFDYSCPHCRKTHAAIKSAKEKLSGELAVVALPVPLNAACNGTIKENNPNFAESCEISKLAIAVWRVDPKKFTEFHNWMFSSEKAPIYQLARAHAEKLVDASNLSKEIESKIPEQYIVKTVELYKKVGGGNVPKLIFPTTSVVGEFTSADSLVDLIKQQSKQ